MGTSIRVAGMLTLSAILSPGIIVIALASHWATCPSLTLNTDWFTITITRSEEGVQTPLMHLMYWNCLDLFN